MFYINSRPVCYVFVTIDTNDEHMRLSYGLSLHRFKTSVSMQWQVSGNRTLNKLINMLAA